MIPVLRASPTFALKQRRRIATCWVMAALAALPSVAFAGESEELEAAKSRVATGSYGEAEQRLLRMLDKSVEPCGKSADLTPTGCRVTDPEIVQKARSYLALALVLNGKKEAARDPIDEIMIQDPDFQFTPDLFPQAVIDLAIEERGRKAAQIAEARRVKAAAEAQKRAEKEQHDRDLKAYISALEAQASTEVEQDKHSRWVAAIPFGVGQYQNGDIGLGVVFTVSELVAAGTMAVTSGVWWDLTMQRIAFENADHQGETNDVNQLKSQLQALQVANDISFGLLLALAVSGIIEAEVTFKQPPPLTKHRPLPPKPKSLEVTGVSGAQGPTVGMGLKLEF
jgi:hypothetical protein